jgi:hypothetical protein
MLYRTCVAHEIDRKNLGEKFPSSVCSKKRKMHDCLAVWYRDVVFFCLGNSIPSTAIATIATPVTVTILVTVTIAIIAIPFTGIFPFRPIPCPRAARPPTPLPAAGGCSRSASRISIPKIPERRFPQCHSRPPWRRGTPPRWHGR